MRVVVTGAAGFIGSNIVAGLNKQGIDDVIGVDDLTDGSKFENLVDLSISDYVDYHDFYNRFAAGGFGKVDVVFHQGACSNTMELDGRFMMESNYGSSKLLLDACAARQCRLVYASSAAVYGASNSFVEDPSCESPRNVYGYSKLLFDQVVRRKLGQAGPQIAGLRYFNVYGPREQHKARMASVAFHHFNQLHKQGAVQLFADYGGFGPGMHARDFIYIDDVVAVNLWLLEHPEVSGVFNLGTGQARPFNDVARGVVNAVRGSQGLNPLSTEDCVREGLIKYIPFPSELVGKYQSYTQANASKLRAAGYRKEFTDVDAGIPMYVQWLLQRARPADLTPAFSPDRR